MLRIFLSVFFLFWAGFSSVQASVIAIEDQGQLIGFDGISFNNETYNVRFVEGSFNSVFGDETGLDFTTLYDAGVAANALLDAYDLFPTYNDESNLTFGITSTIKGHIFTPWKYGLSGGQYMTGSRVYVNLDSDHTNSGNLSDYVTNNVGMIATYDTTGPNNFSATRVWADWSIAISQSTAVPEPASLALMSLGLVGLGFARRKSAA